MPVMPVKGKDDVAEVKAQAIEARRLSGTHKVAAQLNVAEAAKFPATSELSANHREIASNHEAASSHYEEAHKAFNTGKADRAAEFLTNGEKYSGIVEKLSQPKDTKMKAKDDWSPEARKAAAEARKSGAHSGAPASAKKKVDWSKPHAGWSPEAIAAAKAGPEEKSKQIVHGVKTSSSAPARQNAPLSVSHQQKRAAEEKAAMAKAHHEKHSRTAAALRGRDADPSPLPMMSQQTATPQSTPGSNSVGDWKGREF